MTVDDVAQALELPDPELSSAPMLELALDRLAYGLRTSPPDDVETALELWRKVEGIQAYLSRRGQAQAAMTPARLLEARIGELLGEAPGRGRGEDESARGLSRQRRIEFRLLAEHRQSWEPLLPLSRHAALERIERERHPIDERAAFVQQALHLLGRAALLLDRGAPLDPQEVSDLDLTLAVMRDNLPRPSRGRLRAVPDDARILMPTPCAGDLELYRAHQSAHYRDKAGAWRCRTCETVQ